MQQQGAAAKAATYVLATAGTAKKNEALAAIADILAERQAEWLAANAEDVAAAKEAGMRSAMLDRLTLTPERVAGIVDGVRQVVDREGLERMRAQVDQVHIADEILDYMVRLSAATRSHPLIVQGASPRATLAVAAVSRAAAFVRGRDYVIPEDVADIFRDTVAHRLVLTPGCDGTQQDPLGEVLHMVHPPRLR